MEKKTFWVTQHCSTAYVWGKSVINKLFSYAEKAIKPSCLKKQDVLLQLLRNKYFSVHSSKIQENSEQDHLREKGHCGEFFE